MWDLLGQRNCHSESDLGDIQLIFYLFVFWIRIEWLMMISVVKKKKKPDKL